MNKKLLCLMAVCFSLLITPFTYADGGKYGHSCPCMMNEDTMKSLNLTADQQTKIKAIKDQLMSAKTAKKDEIKTINNQLDAMVKMDKIDEGKLDALIKQKQDIHSVWMKNKIMARQQMYNLLNAQQKTQFEALKAKCHAEDMKNLDNLKQYIKAEDLEKLKALKGAVKQLQQ